MNAVEEFSTSYSYVSSESISFLCMHVKNVV
jgi:hypothetical protein